MQEQLKRIKSKNLSVLDDRLFGNLQKVQNINSTLENLQHFQQFLLAQIGQFEDQAKKNNKCTEVKEVIEQNCMTLRESIMRAVPDIENSRALFKQQVMSPINNFRSTSYDKFKVSQKKQIQESTTKGRDIQKLRQKQTQKLKEYGKLQKVQSQLQKSILKQEQLEKQLQKTKKSYQNLMKQKTEAAQSMKAQFSFKLKDEVRILSDQNSKLREEYKKLKEQCRMLQNDKQTLTKDKKSLIKEKQTLERTIGQTKLNIFNQIPTQKDQQFEILPLTNKKSQPNLTQKDILHAKAAHKESDWSQNQKLGDKITKSKPAYKSFMEKMRLEFNSKFTTLQQIKDQTKDVQSQNKQTKKASDIYENQNLEEQSSTYRKCNTLSFDNRSNNQNSRYAFRSIQLNRSNDEEYVPNMPKLLKRKPSPNHYSSCQESQSLQIHKLLSKKDSAVRSSYQSAEKVSVPLKNIQKNGFNSSKKPNHDLMRTTKSNIFKKQVINSAGNQQAQSMIRGQLRQKDWWITQRTERLKETLKADKNQRFLAWFDQEMKSKLQSCKSKRQVAIV